MAPNPNVTPTSQGSGAHDTTGGSGPQDSAVGATHDGGVLPPKSNLALQSNSTAVATAIGGAPTMTKSTIGASSSQMQMGATATLPDDDELEDVVGRPCL
jgi:hypothetical protein